jgi:hypothetical protein
MPSPTPGATLAALALIAALTPAAPRAQEEWSAQFLVGGALNLPMPLTIRQSGQPDLRITARYASRPFTPPIYYGVLLGRRSGGAEWTVELLHQKLYLENPPPEVQKFSVSHGYNLVTVSRGWRLADGLWTRAGLSAVIAHPESTVRGLKLDEGGGILGTGQYLSGIGIDATLEKRFPVAGKLYFALDGKVTAAWAVVPVEQGDASVPSVSAHALAGLGVGPSD